MHVRIKAALLTLVDFFFQQQSADSFEERGILMGTSQEGLERCHPHLHLLTFILQHLHQ